MNLLINIAARISGVWSIIVDLLPIIGGVGGILGAIGSILNRASQSNDMASLIIAVHPNAAELSSLSVGIGLIKSHFNSLKHDVQIAGLKNSNNPQDESKP